MCVCVWVKEYYIHSDTNNALTCMLRYTSLVLFMSHTVIHKCMFRDGFLH